MQYLLCLAYIAFFLFLIQKLKFFETPGLSKKNLSLIFLLKLAGGFLLWAIYTYYYTDRSTSDIFKYYDDSKAIYDTLFTAPSDFFKMLFGIGNDTPHFAPYYEQMNNWHRRLDSNLYNDSHFMIRLNAVLRLISLGSYHVHTIIICFLSLMGLTGIYHFFAGGLVNKSKLFLASVFLLPSVLLWTSGVIKEALIVILLGALLYSVKKIMERRQVFYSLVCMALSLLLLVAIKFYIVVALAPALAAFLWSYKNKIGTIFIKYMVSIFLFVLAGQAVRTFTPAYDPIQVISIKQKDFLYISTAAVYLKNDTATIFLKPEEKNNLLTSDSIHYTLKAGSVFHYFKSGSDDTLSGINQSDTNRFVFIEEIAKTSSRINLPPLKATPASLLKNMPLALYNTLLRPIIPSKQLMISFAAIENWLIILFICLCLIFSKPFKTVDWNYVLMPLTFSLILYLLIGWITPVLGAIVRYKVPALPFLLIAFLYLLDMEKLKRVFRV